MGEKNGKCNVVCGIYSIVNTSNGKRYYGSSLNIWGRKRQHLHNLRKGTHCNKHLQSAWKLYGESCFVFEIIEEVCANQLQIVEQLYLDKNPDGYNTAKCAECAPRGLKWSDESKLRASKARKGKSLTEEHKKNLSKAGMNRKLTDSERIAIKERMTGKPLCDSAKAKLSILMKDRWQDSNYRESMKKSQVDGMNTDEAKKNRSDASTEKWNDPEFSAKMSLSRKKGWSDPVYREKMSEIRKKQGLALRQKNQQQKETEYALS